LTVGHKFKRSKSFLPYVSITDIYRKIVTKLYFRWR